MSGDARTPTWGCRPDGDAQIFDLAPGETLPEGWHASPTCMTDPSLATAEAVTARAAERSRLAAAATTPRPSAWPASSTTPPIAPTAAPPAPRSPALPPGFRRATPQEAQAMMQRLEDEAQTRRAAALARYGPEAQAVAPCARETALRDAAGPLTVPGGADRPPSLMGWTGGPRSSLPPEVRREIGGAVRMPATVAATFKATAAAFPEGRIAGTRTTVQHHGRTRVRAVGAVRPEDAGRLALAVSPTPRQAAEALFHSPE